MAELSGSAVNDRMLEIERASMNSEAQARLSEIRTQLGLPPSEAEGAKLLEEAASIDHEAVGPGDGSTATTPVAAPETSEAEQA